MMQKCSIRNYQRENISWKTEWIDRFKYIYVLCKSNNVRSAKEVAKMFNLNISTMTKDVKIQRNNEYKL